VPDKVVFLVVEADRLLLNEVSNILKEEFDGAVVYNAVDGAEAIKKLRNAPTNVLVVGMEIGTKVPFPELMRTIELDRALNKVPVCVLSDITDTEPRFHGDLTSGRIKFLSMPLQREELVSSVRAMLKAGSIENNTFKTMNLAAGQKLFSEGDKADRAFLVKKGKLTASRGGSGKVIELGEILAGEFVGEMAHITGEPRSADVRAIEDTELIEIPCGTLDLLVFSKPTWTKALLKTLCRRLKDANQKRI
jgi:CRP/FNR family cyclic AMP-dependent transcriptional regulator